MHEMGFGAPARGLASVLLVGTLWGAPWSTAVPPAAAAGLPPAPVIQGHFEELALDGPASGPAIVSVDDDDRIWVALARAGKLAMVTNGRVHTYEFGPDSRPVGVIAGTHANGYPGTVWIAASYDNKIIRFDWRSGQKREYPIPGKESWPFNIALDAKGQVWFTQRAAGALGRLDPASGAITHVVLPRPGTGPAGLGVDRRTGRVWFTQSYADAVAWYDPATGAVTELPMGTSSTGLTSGPAGLAVDAEGGVWFAKLEGQLGYVAPGARAVQLVATPAQARRPAGITLDAAGNVWLGALDGNALVRYEPAQRQFAVFPLPVGAADAVPSSPPVARTSRPFGLAFDSVGNLWFSQQYTGQLGMLSLAAPQLRVFSPGPEVKQADPYVTVQAPGDAAGPPVVRYTLDGQPVQLLAGRLDLSRAAPGTHELGVVAQARNGRVSSVTRRFNYLPQADAVAAVVRALRFRESAPPALRSAVLMTADDANQARRLDDSREFLRTHRDQLAAGEFEAAITTLDWIARHTGMEQVVTILDEAPYFEPNRVRLPVGGSVSWQYRGEVRGHEISHALHQIEVAGLDTRSPLLRAGDRYVQRFDRPGEYTAVDLRRPGAVLTIVVQQ